MNIKDIPLEWNALSPFFKIDAKDYKKNTGFQLQVIDNNGLVILQRNIAQLPFQLATDQLALGQYQYTLKQKDVFIQKGVFLVP